MILEDLLKNLEIDETEKTFEYRDRTMKYQNEELALYDIN